MDKGLAVGDYVHATKWGDGDPLDDFCVGFYAGSYDHFSSRRHLVVDAHGRSFRANGFRRAQRISAARGSWLVKHFPEIESAARAGSRRSVWGWLRMPMRSRASA